MSLFEDIPLSRTCVDAGIPDQFCVCQPVTELSITSAVVLSATRTAIDHLNRLTEKHRNICVPWTLAKVSSALRSTGSAKVDNVKRKYQNYIIIFEAYPKRARFEAIVRSFEGSSSLKVEGDILRISLYGETAHCVQSAFLKNICYCTHQLKH